MSALLRGALRGAAAGASGTTALNTLSYLDMVARARPASTTPEATVEELSKRTGVDAAAPYRSKRQAENIGETALHLHRPTGLVHHTDRLVKPHRHRRMQRADQGGRRARLRL